MLEVKRIKGLHVTKRADIIELKLKQKQNANENVYKCSNFQSAENNV